MVSHCLCGDGWRTEQWEAESFLSFHFLFDSYEVHTDHFFELLNFPFMVKFHVNSPCDMLMSQKFGLQMLPIVDEVMPSKETVENEFSKGMLVEVSSDEDGFQGAWFAATIVERLQEGRFLIEYKSLRNDDDTDFLREEADTLHIRPYPPDTLVVDRFNMLEEVDALYNDGWWVGVISKVLDGQRYVVYFRSTNEEIEFEHSDLRLHQDWIDGKWVMASQV
ncbi:hypothetical protein TEA_009921 [Camellia sinensis var. sinensis]|uniref:Agenet domain-containing protein n=1 Tax=Camellia sinensis var. sinensis TaxID=542762 RepID=A0A4S4D5X4_CAMSN|nr:hypothetical protein TEA_009921 [Camellia sinensis var. sinensis]